MVGTEQVLTPTRTWESLAEGSQLPWAGGQLTCLLGDRTRTDKVPKRCFVFIDLRRSLTLPLAQVWPGGTDTISPMMTGLN